MLLIFSIVSTPYILTTFYLVKRFTALYKYIEFTLYKINYDY